MTGFKCPYCNSVFPLTRDTLRECKAYFDPPKPYEAADNSGINISFYKCPNCNEYIVRVQGFGKQVLDINSQLRPLSSAIQFPDYVPESIRQDYSEACAIVNLSPKASATLSRRCLQTMIRDFWGITEATLYKEIESLDTIIPSTQKKVLHSLRQIGNIGAHPEADINTIIDIEPGDAEKLIKVIEFFVDKWYIDRHEQQLLFDEINNLNDDMQDKKKSDE